MAGNYRRISVQLTTALSALVSEEKLMAEPEIFESSLAKLVSFAYFGTNNNKKKELISFFKY